MILLTVSSLIASLTLLDLVVTQPTSSGLFLVGYRSVHPDQAKLYKDAGNTLVYDLERSGSASNSPFGKGVYLTPSFEEWPPEPDDWFCYVEANAIAFDRVASVVRLPTFCGLPDGSSGSEEDSEKDSDNDSVDSNVTLVSLSKLFHIDFKGNEEVIDKYIAHFGLDPAKTIRITDDDDVRDEEPRSEIVIPPALLKQNGQDLGFVTHCVETEEEFSEWVKMDAAQIDHWKHFGQWENVDCETFLSEEEMRHLQGRTPHSEGT